MLQITADYLAAGGNRHPSAADWHSSGHVAFGADRNIAVWRPLDVNSPGICQILRGHDDIVNAVKFVPGSAGILISGSVDKNLIIWRQYQDSDSYICTETLHHQDSSNHQASINCIAVAPDSTTFVSGAADGTLKIWSLSEHYSASLLQTIEVTPRFFPLALALSPLAGALNSYVLAVAGTKDIIQLYVRDTSTGSADFKLRATLAGHEGWIRSLEFTRETDDPESDLILSSASQDKYIRLWRIHQGQELPAAAASADPSFGAFVPGKSLSNKAHRFKAQGLEFSATFEALLLGHDDWIYSTRWRSDASGLQLLSASADNSLAIWAPDPTTGVWVTITRLGEISAEKGSTTATGSTGGFWTGLWAPSGKTVISLGRTGSWRLWNYDTQQERWIQGIGISGHTQAVTGIAWSKNGDYLLSTSSDQTTRLHAKWKRGGNESWHEMARPQIHGYDLNCIDSLGASQFASGADEKLLRVFSQPKAVANLLSKLCGIEGSQVEDMPDAANMPVLGLSNKAIEAVEDGEEALNGNGEGRDAVDPASILHKSTLDLGHPPSEEHLSRYTLWPEIEKLYGHGYEISTLAASHDGSIIATACKASSIDHAVIRLFETKGWLEIKPPLTAHSLTVTRLRFSADDRCLLSVGRDRQWAVFKRDPDDKLVYKLTESDPKGHTRMILDAAWAPGSSSIFATAGRDKKVRVWARDEGAESASFTCRSTISETHPLTAIDFLGSMVGDGFACLAIGSETGFLAIHSVDIKGGFATQMLAVRVSSTYPNPAKAITQLAWKPVESQTEDGELDMELAIASEDGSLRVFSYKAIPPKAEN